MMQSVKDQVDIERFVVSRAAVEAPVLINEADDDRDNIHAGDQVLLIVENDLQFARFLLDTARRERLQRSGHFVGNGRAGAGQGLQSHRRSRWIFFSPIWKVGAFWNA